MAGTPLADAVNTARVGSLYFGPSPFPRLSITQQHAAGVSAVLADAGLSVDDLASVGGSDLAPGLPGIDPRALQSLKEFGNTVTWHEVAHQWWGHQVGWASYRDQWLSEGFAEFTSALLLEVNSGRKKADAFWEQKRGEMFGKTIGVANHEAGAITQGVRLRTPPVAAGRAGDHVFEGRLRRPHAAHDDARGRTARSGRAVQGDDVGLRQDLVWPESRRPTTSRRSPKST